MAAKGGVLALTRQLAAELAPLGIRINSVGPGVVETGLNQQILEQAALRRETSERIPRGELGDSYFDQLERQRVELRLVRRLVRPGYPVNLQPAEPSPPLAA